MRYRRRLRSRIIFSFLLFGTLLSVLFAFAVLQLQSKLEEQFIGDTLKKELDDFVVQLRRDPTVVEPFHTRIAGYISRPGDASEVPSPFRALPDGVHKVDTPNGVYRAAIYKGEDFWVFLTQNVTENQRIGKQLFYAVIGVVILFSLGSFALGIWSSRRVMRPVTDLADRLEHLDETRSNTDLASFFADDEVGQLAAALDDYAGKVQQMAERDREFNADVSHELRTPLSVISGATELLLAQTDLPDKVRTRVLRIARAARQSSDITTALLHLVRAEKGVTQDSDAHSVAEVANQLSHLYEPLLGSKLVELHVIEQERVSVIAPESVIAVCIGNLIGNAVRYTQEGEVTIRVGNGGVQVEDTGPGIPPQELPHVFERHFRGQSSTGKGSGLGLAIVKRLCELYGWSIRIRNRPERSGLVSEIRFFDQDIVR